MKMHYYCIHMRVYVCHDTVHGNERALSWVTRCTRQRYRCVQHLYAASATKHANQADAMRAHSALTDTVAPPTESTPSNTPGATAAQHENEGAATHTDRARAGTAMLPALRTPPTTTGTDAPHTHLASDDDDEMEDDSDSARPHSEEGAATPRTKLALLEKRLEFNIDDYDEIVDDDDVESVPAPHACMRPPICAARRGRLTPAVRPRPPPLLRTHTGAVPLRSPPL